MISKITIGIVATAIITAIAGYGVKMVYDAGRDSERVATLNKAVELVKERDKIDAKLKTATPADICRRLGGQWLPDENECG